MLYIVGPMAPHNQQPSPPPPPPSPFPPNRAPSPPPSRPPWSPMPSPPSAMPSSPPSPPRWPPAPPFPPLSPYAWRDEDETRVTDALGGIIATTLLLLNLVGMLALDVLMASRLRRQGPADEHAT